MDLCIAEVDARVGLLAGEEILGLSIMQPWVACIMDVAGGPGEWKDVENRSWRRTVPPGGMWVALHAAKAEDDDAVRMLSRSLPHIHRQLVQVDQPRSAVVGAVHVVAWDSLWDLQVRGVLPRTPAWASGPYCAVFDQRVKLDLPIPCMGARGMWHLPSPILRQVLAATGNAAAAERMPAPTRDVAWGPAMDCRPRRRP